jgi:phage N-6-adenine-methyltransferase
VVDRHRSDGRTASITQSKQGDGSLSERARIPEKQVTPRFKGDAKPKKAKGRALAIVQDRDAAEIGELYLQARRSIIGSVVYLIECGNRLIAKKASMEHGKWEPWLDANADVLAFEHKSTARRLMKCAREYIKRALARDLIDEVQALAISRIAWGHEKAMVTKYTGDHESYTPARIIEAVRKAMGSIDLDPASNEGAQEIVQAAEWYGVADDGLSREWSGNVFLNPPFEHAVIKQFINKLCDEYLADNVEQAVLLTNNSTDTKWWRRAAEVSAGVCFTLGRINFYKADGEITQPTNGQCLIYFGDNLDRFAEAFAEIGFIMVEKDA